LSTAELQQEKERGHEEDLSKLTKKDLQSRTKCAHVYVPIGYMNQFVTITYVWAYASIFKVNSYPW
jgi:hypothetical protein